VFSSEVCCSFSVIFFFSLSNLKAPSNIPAIKEIAENAATSIVVSIILKVLGRPRRLSTGLTIHPANAHLNNTYLTTFFKVAAGEADSLGDTSGVGDGETVTATGGTVLTGATAW
jgi:hypothetical protein